MNKIYIGNLAYKVTQDDLSDFFSEHGDVGSATVIMDRDTGRSKGFGFVEFEAGQNIDAIIEKTNGAELLGRAMRVALANKKESN